MIKTDKNIDYGAALSSIYEKLKMAEKKVQSNDMGAYAQAYGIASMGIKMLLVTCSDLTMNQIYEETRAESKNDIPPDLFVSGGAK